MRSFVALELPEATLDGLLRFGREIRIRAPGWAKDKWVRREALHVTLKFLDEMEAEQLDALTAGLERRLSTVEAVAYSLDGARAVPSLKRASMLWAAPAEETTGMAAVAAAVDEEAVAVGAPADERPFRTHVTLVRTRRTRHIAQETLSAAWGAAAATASASTGRASDASAGEGPGKAPFGILSVGEVTVFTSTLTRSGPVYDVWARVPLGRA